jgi:quercetin dioxygenase-like cupin family protein
MALIRRGEAMEGDLRKPQGGFTGDADQRPIHAQLSPEPARISFVRFQPGATTHWHSHSGGQVLHVVDGEGRAQDRGAEVVVLKPGDTLTAEAGRDHWHGAAPGSEMTHLAVTIGEVNWKEAPDEPPR